MKSLNIKSIFLLLAICLILPAFKAGALFDADHYSSGNTIIMGELDAILSASSSFSNLLTPTNTSIMEFTATTTKPVVFRYKLSTEDLSGDLCPAINIRAVVSSSSTLYDGPLSGLLIVVGPPFSLPQDWKFTASLIGNNPSLEHKTCDFKLRFKALIPGYSDLEEGGFYDVEKLEALISSGRRSGGCGGVVINEIMWMGSEESGDDEWIELRNASDYDKDIGKWKLENVTYAKSSIKIPANTILPAGGYYLISRYQATNTHSFLAVEPDQVAGSLYLRNTQNGTITLRNEKGEIIDKAQGNPWPAGKFGQVWQSMERNAVPGNGLDPSSWHTSTLSSANDTVYWDLESLTFGTPKMRNTIFNGCEYGTEPECKKNSP